MTLGGGRVGELAQPRPRGILKTPISTWLSRVRTTRPVNWEGGLPRVL
jgi:hypothetical protein